MMAPGNMNIRRAGWATPQRMKFGIPVVYPGDYMAQRPVAGHPARLVFYRQPWEAGPFIRTPAASLPRAAMGGTTEMTEFFRDVISGSREDFEQNVAEQAVDTAFERIRPYLFWGALVGVGLIGASAYVGYTMGRSES